jgi:hypothetical protein
MSTFPTNALSRDPAGRLADIQELIQAGFIDQSTATKLLDFPDLQSEMNMLNADAHNLDKIIENMIDKGEYFPPEPYQNLENAIRKVQQAYLMYKMRGAPEERLDLLRQYMEDAQGLLAKAQETTPTPTQLTQELAAQGAQGAAEAVAEQAGVGDQTANLLVEGAIPLGEESLPEEVPLTEEEILAAEEPLTEDELIDEGLV